MTLLTGVSLLGFTSAGAVAADTGRTVVAAPATSVASSESEVVALPEFAVSGDRLRGEWAASQAMSGTRTAASLIELPYQVQVLTEEFLADFQLIGLTNQMTFFTAYSGGADLADPAIGGSGQAGNMLRGFAVTIIRDGFSSNGTAPPPTISNTAQVENIKGPISTLYGDAQPGGLINYITKRPSLSPRYSLSLSTGSYDYWRSNLSASGPILGKQWYYLLSVDNTYRKGAMQYTYARTGDYLFSLLWKPGRDTSFKVTYEAVRLVGARAASIPSLVTGTRVAATNPLSWSAGTTVGIDWRLARNGYSRFGPNERYNRDYDGINALFEHAYSPTLKQRISYQGSWKHFNLLYRTNSNVSAETNRMTGVQPNKRVQSIIGPVAVQTDLLSKFTAGGMKHELLFSADYSRLNTRDYQLRLPTAAVASLPALYTYQDPFNPYWPEFDYTLLTRMGSKGYENLRSTGGGVSDRIFFAEGRLILMGNLRYSKNDFEEDSSTTTYVFTKGHANSTTHSVGLNYKLLGTNRLVLFANESTSFNANPTVDQNTGTTIPNECGRGLEVGFKTLTQDQQLGLTLSAYEIKKTNIGQTNPDYVLGNGLPQYLGSGVERVRGTDGDISWQVNREWTLTGGATYLDPRVVSSTTAALRNTRKLLVPLTSFSTATQYRFNHWLKGLRVGAAFRHTGSFVRANATASRLYEISAPRQLTDVFARYSWKSRRFLHTVALNGNNVFDKFYVGPELTVGLGRQINVSYKIDLQ